MKNAVAKKTQNTRLVTITPWAEESDTATKINYLDKVVKECGRTTVQAAIMCGWLLSIEKANRQGTFVAWADANLEVSSRTVYNYMTLFERAIASHSENLQLECNDKTRQKMVEEYAETVESKTLTELYCDLGIVKKSKSNLGGHREGAGRKPKEVSDAAAAAEAADAPEFAIEGAARAAADLWRCGVTESGFAAMEKGVLEKLISLIDDTLANAKAQLKAKKAK